MSEGQDAYWKAHEEENERLHFAGAPFWQTISFLLVGVLAVVIVMWFYAVGR